MSHRFGAEALYLSIQDLMGNNDFMGGKTVLLSRDLRQIGLAVKHGGPPETVDASIIYSMFLSTSTACVSLSRRATVKIPLTPLSSATKVRIGIHPHTITYERSTFGVRSPRQQLKSRSFRDQQHGLLRTSHSFRTPWHPRWRPSCFQVTPNPFVHKCRHRHQSTITSCK
ncbi:unnamed protein product [Hapterophycus canaliculatus]